MSGELGQPHKDQYSGETAVTAAPRPNTGGVDAGELMDRLLSNEHIPQRIKEQFWVLFSNTLKLTFITPEIRDEFMDYFELIRLTILESIPKSEYTEEMEMLFYSLYLEFKGNLSRAVGHRMNERELMASNTYATFTERPLSNGQSENVPFFSRLMRIATGGGQ